MIWSFMKTQVNHRCLIPAGETAKMVPRLVFSLGGTVEGNMHAQADSWKKAIEFFKK